MQRDYASYIIAFFSTLVRYYDYSLFGLSGAMIAGRFMPDSSNSDQILTFFLIFSIAVFARPLGSIFFGKIGDNIGRVAAVKISTFLAAISTILIAFIPSYSEIGFLAVMLITLCRMLFMASLAGESDVIKVYIAEKVGAKRRHFASSLVYFFSQIGCLIAAYLCYLSNDKDINGFELWRVNFIYGGLGGFILLLFRGFYKESELFVSTKQREKLGQASILCLIGRNKPLFLISIVANGICGASYNFLIIFFSTFAFSALGFIEAQMATMNNMILIVIYALSSLVSGFVADKVKVFLQIKISLSVAVILTIMWAILLNGGDLYLWMHRMLVFLVPIYVIPIQVRLQSLFDTSERVRMYSLSHSLGSMMLSATIPFISMLVWKHTNSVLAVLVLFILLLIILLQIVSYMAKKQYSDKFE